MPELTVGDIRKRAYELWENAGGPEGEMDRFWHEAEQKLEPEKSGGQLPQDRLE